MAETDHGASALLVEIDRRKAEFPRHSRSHWIPDAATVCGDMADDLAAALLDVIDLAQSRPQQSAIILAFGSLGAQARAAARQQTHELELEDAFEAWLIERWLREIRSEAFRESAQAEYLRAEWERGR